MPWLGFFKVREVWYKTIQWTTVKSEIVSIRRENSPCHGGLLVCIYSGLKLGGSISSWMLQASKALLENPARWALFAHTIGYEWWGLVWFSILPPSGYVGSTVLSSSRSPVLRRGRRGNSHIDQGPGQRQSKKKSQRAINTSRLQQSSSILLTIKDDGVCTAHLFPSGFHLSFKWGSRKRMV